jgi:hypothetical protein
MPDPTTPFAEPPRYPAPSGKTMYAAHLLDPDGETVQVGFLAAATDDEAITAIRGVLGKAPDWSEAVSFHLFREVTVTAR